MLPKSGTLRPLNDEGFEWPSLFDIKDFVTFGATLDLWTAKSGGKDVIWIPADASALQQRLSFVAHCGPIGHRSKFAKKMHLKRLFWLDQLDVKLTAFMDQCLLCPHVKGGRVIQRPPSQLWYASRPNEGILFDFLYLGDSFKGSKYELVLKDDLTHYCELV
ncbi:hypothetical protein SDRG_08839 [Saprolegnia diclina VS20]|uniref:Integrase zinc-binding domain-containing protein n=1 Tax=Saprolegnia diclina (strain VS20) TaxID=1156394 RepID=T0RTR9_SAPDV|nr:hypothetical protein SDRG_08839 [Saprolegnia diclina VS20]EQC33737.1 hypothetical protein SDRG_08839 [Saprolegnia diclina VS20]|eukprot:XP_008612960.1 hypothetical protein SDRG_08839 [Saprolegnia diclina VS20]